MSEFYKLLIVALSVCSLSFPQISDITRLPVQNPSQSIKESAPVWISENEILIFYVSETLDTIYSTRSTDRGNSWHGPNTILVVEPNSLQDLLYLTSIKTNSGRIILCWLIRGEGAKEIHSDDKGINWSQKKDLNISPFNSLADLNLSLSDSGRLYLCFNLLSSNNQYLYYSISDDDGNTWSEIPEQIFFSSRIKVRDLTIISSTGTTLTGIFQMKIDNTGIFGIYRIVSSDNGETWSDTINIARSEKNLVSPNLEKDSEGTLWLTYQEEDTIRYSSSQSGYYVTNYICYKKSFDDGLSWAVEQKLTSYIGDDNYINTASFSNRTFVSFSTVRFTAQYQVSFAVLDETIETYTPPYLFWFDSDQYQSDEGYFRVLAYIVDDEEISEVKFLFTDSTLVGNLYDDGLHFDGEPQDNIFGNQFPKPDLGYLTSYLVDVNKLIIPISNYGLLADVDFRDTFYCSLSAVDNLNNKTDLDTSVIIYSWSGGRFEEGTFLFSSGFFLSGYSNSELWANGVASSTLLEDYLPGIENSNPDDPIFNFYVINKDDVPFGSSWQRWKDAVGLGAEFYDGDGDGIYNPIDKNWNGTWDPTEDMPPLIGDEIAWCVYNDGVPANQRRWQAEPQGTEIRQTIFGSNHPELENVLFIKYSILNTGSVAEVMDSVHFGIWEDTDLGDHTDDVVGCDTLLQSGFFYNANPDQVYGENCPSFFTTYLQGPIVSTGNFSDTAKSNFGQLIGVEQMPGSENISMTSHVFHIGGDPFLNDPSSINEAVNYLKGKTRIGDYPDPCNFPYCEVRGGVNCSEINPLFWASGDPVADVGWINKMNVDHRNLISTGPFQLEKNKPQEIIVAYVMGRGTDYFNSITVARENVQRAIAEYESNFVTMTYSPPPATNPVNSYVLYQNYPNPFNPVTTIRYELPQDGVVTIEVFDILGQKVRTILNEFKKADRCEINYNSIGLASGVYIYRMRVNDYIESKKMLLLK